MTSNPATVPKHLDSAGRRLWRRIAAQWEADDLEPDNRELAILEMAAEEADLLALMAAELDAVAATTGSLTVRGSQGQPVTHGHVASCRQSRALIANLLGRLGFDSAVASGGMTAAEAGRRGAMVRHHGNPDGLARGGRPGTADGPSRWQPNIRPDTTAQEGP